MVKTTPVVIYKERDYDKAMGTIAVTDASVFNARVIEVLFPDAELIKCDSTKGCLEAVALGRAGSTIIPSARINIVRNDPLMDKLHVAEMATKKEVSLVSTMENRRAASIVNKAILHSSATVDGMVFGRVFRFPDENDILGFR